MINLTKKKCIPCEDANMKPFTKNQAQEYLALVPGWELAKNNKSISRTVLLKNFVTALKKVNDVGAIAEQEGHHPDIAIHYNRVDLKLYTHSIGGLTENDFIVAAKINRLFKK